LLLPKAGIIDVLGGAPSVAPTEPQLEQLRQKFSVGQITANWHVTNRFNLD